MGDRSRLQSDELIPCSSCDGKEVAEITWMSKTGGRGSLNDLEGIRDKESGENIRVADKGKDTGKMGG